MTRFTLSFALVVTFGFAPSAQADTFSVNDGDFIGNVYDFHYYNDLNNTQTSATVINGVNQGISDPTRTNNGWPNVDRDANSSGYVRYWKSASGLTGDLTMGWDFSDVTGTIESIEVKTRHYIFQFYPWIPHATGDQIYGQIATPGTFGTGTYTDLYRITADAVDGGHGTGALMDITSSVSSGWLSNPGLLELKLGYIKQDDDISTRHIQVFRDDTGIGDDGFVLRVTLTPDVDPIPEPSTLVGLISMGLMGLAIAWRRRRRAA